MASGDLNKLSIPDDGNRQYWHTLSDYSTRSSDGSITVYFRELEENLIKLIQKSKMVVGCVAWMTSTPIIQALSKLDYGVSIVVQKEDFLRPDINSNDGWKEKLGKKYDTLKQPFQRFAFGDLVGSLSYCGDQTVQPVRCIGNHNRDKKPAFPRMHNKFLIFCDVQTTLTNHGDENKIKPYSVWTGSFNFTKNASMSLENALVINDAGIVDAYYNEFQQVLALSERLDWRNDWCEPEWRIGS